MLELREVSKRYGTHWALHASSLCLEVGRTCVLIGPSGCGKSTLLRIAVALVAPTSGSVWIAGEELSTRNVLLLRRKVGYVIQEGGLFPHLTAEENVGLMSRFLGWPAGRIRDRLLELAELTRFPADGLRKYPAELSGGQRQRVSLMRALMLDPELLLLDEPLGSLDPMIRSELQADLRDIFRRLGKTAVFVTHNMGEAVYFGDTIVLLREGRLVQQGTVDELVDRPADPFVTRFLSAQRGTWSEGN